MPTSTFYWISPYQLVFVIPLFFTYLATVSIYRLYFHPLANFPGPKLAALTSFYACYYDLYMGGQYIWAIEDMHAKYGPIVRVRPDALHVNDPAFIDKLYTSSPKQRRERYKTILRCINGPGSILGTKDHDLHRNRRAVIFPYFSKANVRRLEPVINDTLTSVLRRMRGWAKTGEPVQLNTVFRAATKDIIQAYAFGESEKFLEMEDCGQNFFRAINAQRLNHIATYFHWLTNTLAALPPKITLFLFPHIVDFANFVEGIGTQIDQIRLEKPTTSNQTSKTILHEILHSNKIPASEKTTKRLREEAFVIVIAGSETTASTLVAIFYHVLASPTIFHRLRTELETVMPHADSAPDASKLDTLPFLNALINEALRLYPGATHRQDRVAPDEELLYTDPTTHRTHVIPRGSAVGMTAPLINRHRSLYRDPHAFDPDRYVRDPTLTRHAFTFGRGARHCVGMALAYQELQTFTAGVFRRYGRYDREKAQAGPTLELFRTARDHVALHADFITLGTRPGSLRLRVVVRD